MTQIVHFEIPADDTGKAREFYTQLFGWQFKNYPGPSEYWMGELVPEQSGVAITNMEPGKRGNRAYFGVDDINAEGARVRDLGGEASDAMPVPNMGWFVTCKDPHGNEFGLWQSDENAPAPTG